jgi:hypothetical protein
MTVSSTVAPPPSSTIILLKLNWLVFYGGCSLFTASTPTKNTGLEGFLLFLGGCDAHTKLSFLIVAFVCSASSSDSCFFFSLYLCTSSKPVSSLMVIYFRFFDFLIAHTVFSKFSVNDHRIFLIILILLSVSPLWLMSQPTNSAFKCFL